VQDSSTLRFHSAIWLQDFAQLVLLWLQSKQSLLLRHVLYGWQSKIRQILMCFSEIFAHGIDKHFVLALQVCKGALQLNLQVAQVVRHFTYGVNKTSQITKFICIIDDAPQLPITYLYHSRAGSPAAT
jgi:hypothetical protein